MDYRANPELMSQNNGSQPIGASQRTIAFSAVADGGTLNLNGSTYNCIRVTAAGHGLKKYQYVNIASGTYAGIRTVQKVIDANTILLDGTFSVTQASNMVLTAAKDGLGFYVDSVPLTFSSFVPESDKVDPVAFQATQFIAGTYIQMPFKSLVVATGNITIVRQAIKSVLGYSNR